MATIDMGRKEGAAVPHLQRAGTPSNTMWPGPRSTIDMGQKLDGSAWCAFFPGVAESPSNTKSPGLRPTSIPSGILMHPAVWSQ